LFSLLEDKDKINSMSGNKSMAYTRLDTENRAKLALDSFIDILFCLYNDSMY